MEPKEQTAARDRTLAAHSSAGRTQVANQHRVMLMQNRRKSVTIKGFSSIQQQIANAQRNAELAEKYAAAAKKNSQRALELLAEAKEADAAGR